MKLRVEELSVESFEVASGKRAGEGTVHARQDDLVGAANTVDVAKTPGRLDTCYPGLCTCDGLPTCDVSGCYPCPASDPMICPKADTIAIAG